MQANQHLDLAAKEIAASTFEPVSSNLLQIGRALERIFEVQYQVWALKPDLLPSVLRGPADDPEAALNVALERANRLASDGANKTAIAVLQLFLRYQSSRDHKERANEQFKESREQAPNLRVGQVPSIRSTGPSVIAAAGHAVRAVTELRANG